MRCAEVHSYTNDTALRDYDKGYHAGRGEEDRIFGLIGSLAGRWRVGSPAERIIP
jgi:hypothetical protein